MIEEKIENCTLAQLIEHLTKMKEKFGGDVKVVLNHVDTKKAVTNVEVLASKSRVVIFGV